MRIEDIDSRLYAVVDVETTGLNPRFGDRVCEIGIVVARQGQIVDTFCSLVNPQRPISPGASAVNGISDEMVAAAPLFAEVAGDVQKRLEGNILICHNAPFDLGFLQVEYSRLGQVWQAGGVLDTLAIARQFGSFPSNSLGAIASHLGLNVAGAHRALGDALTTFQLWQYFQGMLGDMLEDYIRPFSIMENHTTEQPIPALLEEALTQQMDIMIEYIDRTGNATCRVIRPQEVFADFGGVYLVAYCHLRQEQRQFRLDRIVSIQKWRDK